MNKVAKIDALAAQAARPLQNTKIDAALGWVATLGDQPQLRMLCAGTITIGLVRGDGRLALAGARMLLAHETATAIKAVIKDRIDRRRPRSLDKHKAVGKPHFGHDRGKEESSFPSGHSAGASAVARAFARSYPQHKIGAYAAAGAAALVQIPRSAHYPSDVGAGLAIGMVSEEIISWLLPATSQGSSEEQDSDV